MKREGHVHIYIKWTMKYAKDAKVRTSFIVEYSAFAAPRSVKSSYLYGVCNDFQVLFPLHVGVEVG
jgi:hypothetical protein